MRREKTTGKIQSRRKQHRELQSESPGFLPLGLLLTLTLAHEYLSQLEQRKYVHLLMP